MDIRIRESGAVTVVEMIGELDASNSNQALASILATLKPNVRVVLDMKELRYMSSAGVRVVKIVDQRSKPIGGRMVLARLSNEVRTMLETLGILRWIRDYETLEAALAALTTGEGGADGQS